MLRDDLRHALQPAAFARERLAFAPDRWQARVLNWRGRRLLLNVSRQGGKSVTAAALALHRVLFCPGALVLCVSPSLRQSSELFRKVGDHLARLTGRPTLTEENKLSLTLESGSRIVSLPSSEATIRGYSGVNLIIEDEASRVPDDLSRTVRGMLATTDGQHLMMSTPWGRRGHFYDAWTGEAWEKIEVPARDISRISAEWLAEERRTVPALWFQQEFECRFVDCENQVFSTEYIEAALDDSIEPLVF